MTARPRPPRRLALIVATALLAAACGAVAAADAYPAKPITIVVPFPAGGGTDVIFRTVQARLQAELGVPVVIDNRAGAGGTVGTGHAAKAAPDGYTLVAATTTTIASAQAVYPRLPYDPLADLAPVGTLGTTPFVLVVSPTVPAKNLADFIRDAKARPGTLNYGSIGNGTASHLAGELFKQRTGIEMTHIPYRGAAPAQTDLMAGQVQALFDNPTALAPQVRAGRMRALAISQPSAVFPELPSFEASGIKDFRPELWYGLMVPAATPRPVVERLRGALDKALQDSNLRADMMAKGVSPASWSPEQFGQRVRADIALWGGIARAVNAKAD